MTRYSIVTCIAMLLHAGCIKLDFFLFDSEEAEAIAVDYHGLPVCVTDSPPSWVDENLVEREIYLTVPGGSPIDPERLDSYNQYLHGVFLAAPLGCPANTCPLVGTGVTFLYTHGNSGDLFRYWYRAVALWSMGANVFTFTYRGYGLSKGEASRAGIKEDAETAADYVLGRGDVEPDKVVVYGYSMGGITASFLVGASPYRDRFAGAVVESGLDSPEEILHRSTGTGFPGGFFFDDEPFNGPEFIRGSAKPVLHIHGGRDQRVMIEQADSYHAVLAGRAGYTHYIGKSDKEHEQWIRQAGHRNLPAHAFGAEDHIADYWDHPDNPSHCCVHPYEYGDPAFQSFLRTVGGTDGEAMLASAAEYRDLVSTWVASVIR